MSAVRVAVPVYRGKRKFHLEKGRRWSIVEHLVLASLAGRPKSVLELSVTGGMHQRLVIEILIRLMRAGWVELRAQQSELVFAVSTSGAAAAARSELPVVATPVARWMNFVVDRITGTVFKPRELPFLHKNAVLEREKRERIVWLEPATFEGDYQVEDLVDHLFRDDEHFIAMERAGDRLMERYALVLVRGGKAEGLPGRAPERLRQAIVGAANRAPEAGPAKPVPVSSLSLPPDETQATFKSVHFAEDDLLIGAQDNEQALLQLIAGAREHLVIHSTFVSKNAFERLKPHLLEAARKGARVELMWGESDDPRSTGRTRKVVAALREELAAAGDDELVGLHPRSTRSHAKFAIADRHRGAPVALLGSRNWLSAGLELVDAGVRIREPKIIAELLYQAAELSRGRDGHWNELTSQLASYAALVARLPGSRNGNASARLILGPDHRDVLRIATECARSRIFVTSHRVSASARQAFLVPLSKSLEKQPGLDATVGYGIEPTPPEPAWATIAQGFDLSNVEVVPPGNPEVHAKLVGWDDDDIVVTSQNWLSADPSQGNPRREIGIHLRSAGLAGRAADALREITR